jgi:hypothetical protein
MAVDVAYDGAEALHKARVHEYDVVVLDRDLPELLGERERLGEIVVGAEGKPVDHVVERARRGEHQHPRLGRLLGQRGAHLVAVQLRQVAIEHDDVVLVHARLVQRLGAVVGDIHRHGLAAQAAGDRVGEAGFVFGDQYTHGTSGRDEARPCRGYAGGVKFLSGRHSHQGVLTFGARTPRKSGRLGLTRT